MSLLDLWRVPPQCIDLEEAVLGALMLDADAFNQVCSILKPESFYKESHAKIYSAIKGLSERGQPVDILTVTEKLRKLNELESVGGAYAIAMLSSKVATAVHIEYHTKIIIQKYLAREMIRICNERLNDCYDDSIDIDDLISGHESELKRISDHIVVSQNIEFKDVIAESMTELEKRSQNYRDNIHNGIHTGLCDLDRITGGWQNGDLIILAGRPSMGKTAYALHSAKTCARFGLSVSFFSLEMKKRRLADRILIGESEIESSHYRDGRLDQSEYTKLQQAINRVYSHKIYIDDMGAINPAKIRSILINRKKNIGVDICFIDYLGLMQMDGKNKNLAERVGDVTRELKGIAKEIDIPIILLAQMNRDSEKRAGAVPQLSDLRDSGNIEQDADLVIFIYRPEYYKADTFKDEETGKVVDNIQNYGFLKIAKNRNGETGKVEFKHNESKTNFYDYTDMTAPENIQPNKAF
jgi:replicative DNA helicase